MKPIEQAKTDRIYPWFLFFEPSQTDKELTRLCLGHDETDQYLIIETYYDDELDDAFKIAASVIRNVKHKIDLRILHEAKNPARKNLIRNCLTSRSTLEVASLIRFRQPLSIITGGCRPWGRNG